MLRRVIFHARIENLKQTLTVLTIKRLASQFSVCKWGYAFLRNRKIMKASSDTMVEPCFVSSTEKGRTYTKMETCTRVNGNGTKSTDMVFIRM